MEKKTKEQLARELPQVALACLATATGGLFADPALASVLAAGASTAFGRWLDRINLSRRDLDYLETARTTLLQLTAGYSDEEVASAFATALAAITKCGLSARRFARLNFDAHRAATEVANASNYHNLTRTDEHEQPSLAFLCLQALYESYRQHPENSNALEHAFQSEVLTRTSNLSELEAELRPFAAAFSWQALLRLPARGNYPEASPINRLSPRYQLLP